jgi:hypothetical protein
MIPPEGGHGPGAQNVGLPWHHSMSMVSSSTPLWCILGVFGIVETDRRMKSGGIEFPSVSLVLLV